MSTRDDARRGGPVHYHTVTVGKGKSRRTLRVAIVPKAGTGADRPAPPKG